LLVCGGVVSDPASRYKRRGESSVRITMSDRSAMT
jgi:hypothetical protein